MQYPMLVRMAGRAVGAWAAESPAVADWPRWRGPDGHGWAAFAASRSWMTWRTGGLSRKAPKEVVNGKPWAEFNKDKETITVPRGLTSTVTVTAQY